MIKEPKSDYILKSLNISDTSDYALVIKGLTPEPLIVKDQSALLKNKEKVKNTFSWMSLLPGEGARKLGLFLFQNRMAIKKLEHRMSKDFQVGDLLDFGKPAELIVEDLTSIEFNKRYEVLKKNASIYIISPDASELPKLAAEFNYPFRLNFTLNSLVTCGLQEFDVAMFVKKLNLDLSLWSKQNLKSAHKLDVSYSNYSNPTLVSDNDPFMILTNQDPNKPEYLGIGEDVNVYTFSFSASGQKNDLELFKKFPFPNYTVLGCDLRQRTSDLVKNYLPNTDPSIWKINIFDLTETIKFPELNEKTFRIEYFKTKN